jgi:hypothetical protein
MSPDAAAVDTVVQLLDEQRQLHGTGAIEAGAGTLFVVFGHPLHAAFGETVGLDAVIDWGRALDRDPSTPVAWLPGRTSGNVHSLRPTYDVVSQLRRFSASAPALGPIDEEPPIPLGDLSLRGQMALANREEPSLARPGEDEMWPIVISSVCALIEARLHRHSRELTGLIRAADPSAEGLRAAISKGRELRFRAVDRAAQLELLDEAERLVSERAH